MYRNYEKSALMELEYQKTGNYGADYEDEECVDDLSFMYDEDDISDAEYDDYCSEKEM